MKVKELVKELEQQDPELEVLCISEDEEILPLNEVFRLFRIESITGSEVVSEREGEPVSAQGKPPIAENHVTMVISSDY